LAAWRTEAALARLDRGEREAAHELATEEVALARDWGAPRTLGRALRVAGLAERGEEGLALLRESLTVLRRSPARLERAKTRVARLAAEGLTNRTIAQTLFVTSKTVEVHLSSAYRKLDIRSRRQLPAALVRPADERRGAPGD